jgi:hypothetical protein
VADYGVRVGKIDRDDIPATHNLVPNAICRVWPTASVLPTGWKMNQTLGPSLEAPVITRETDPRYTESGGQSIRARWASTYGDIQEFVAAPLAVMPHRAQGYLSYFIRVITLRGHINVWATVFRNPYDNNGLPSPFFTPTFTSYFYNIPHSTGGFGVNDLVLPLNTNKELNTAENIGIQAAWDLGRYPLYAGHVLLGISPTLTEEEVAAGQPIDVECIIEAAQLTVSHEQMPLLEGNGGVRLHQAANERLGRYSSPAPVVSVNLLELIQADGLRFPYEQLHLGGSLKLIDPDTEVEAITTRVIGSRRDWQNRTMPSVELSNERLDIAALLAQPPRAPRHQVRTVPTGTRGLTYAT